MKNFEIRFASVEEVLPLRIEVLRNGKFEPTPHHNEDVLDGSFHVGYFIDNQVIGIASFHPVTLQEYPGTGYQLRGMAVKTDFQNQKIGKKILEFGEMELKNKKIDFVWCNAREKAFPFYLANEYSFISDMFDIPMIGPHKKMLKKLNL